jgi:hypothetical protein
VQDGERKFEFVLLNFFLFIHPCKNMGIQHKNQNKHKGFLSPSSNYSLRENTPKEKKLIFIIKWTDSADDF